VIGESRIALRTAGFEDAEQIARLATQLGYPSSVEQVRARMERITSENLGRVIVAVDERGSVIGWTHVFVAHRMESEPFAEIGGLVVDEGHRNRGVGRILLEEAERWTMASGVSILRVRSNMIRRDAHRFYERAGYSCQKTQGVFDKHLSRE
jgi:GNAT superfamily N-acetyltransferase